jgi:excinuclease UvrABC nuclease subunit
MKEFDSLEDLANAKVEKLQSLGFPLKLANKVLETVRNRDE